jgi:DNA ligase (NAD+)
MATKEEADRAYERGDPVMTDAEYDSAFSTQATADFLDDKSPWAKCKHAPGFGVSLAKVDMLDKDNKIVFKNVADWMKKYPDPRGYVISLKYDGASLTLYYEKGKLIRALTKGKGGIGEDVLRNVLKMKSVRADLYDFAGEVRAEAVLRYSTFEKHLKDVYANTRNGTTGAVKDFEGKQAHHVSLRYYGITGTASTEAKAFDVLNNWFGNVKSWTVQTIEEFKTCYNEILAKRADFDYAIDGIVLTMNTRKLQEAAGRDPSGRPNYSVALKFPYQSKRTRLKEIVWQAGIVEGVITPVAIFDVVDLGGANVTRASLKNLDEMKRLQISVGDSILVSKRGDVIPNIESNFTHHTAWQLDYPRACVTCAAPTIIDGPFLRCSNEDCDMRKLGDILVWINVIKDHFKSKGLAAERVQSLFDAKLIKDVADLYSLTPEQLIRDIQGVKAKAAASILSFQAHRKVPLAVFLAALNFPGMGLSLFESIVEAGYGSLGGIMQASVDDLCKCPNIGKQRAKDIYSHLKKRRIFIMRLLQHIEIETQAQVLVDSTALAGKSFCITGTLSKPRSHFEQVIKRNGGKWATSVTTSLDYLIVGDDAGSKAKKAQNGHTKIIGETDLLKMLEK